MTELNSFFPFMMVWKQYTFGRNHTLNFEFWYFPGLDVMLSRDAQQWTQPPVSQVIMRIDSWYTSNHSVPRQSLLYSTFSTVSQQITWDIQLFSC